MVNQKYSQCLQLQLLLQYLKDDPRKAVKRLAINDLKLLAKKAPHLWTRENTQVDLLMPPLVCRIAYCMITFFLSLQTLCECALNSPYIILKLGMMAVLSTLSGTIAIKQYLRNMTGCTSICPSLWIYFLLHSIVNFLFVSSVNCAYRWCADYLIMVLLIFFFLFFLTQVALQFPLALLTWLNWHKNAVTTATWQLLLMGS